MSACAAFAASTLASPTLPGKARRIASSTLSSDDDADCGGEGAEQRGVGRGPVDVFHRKLGRRNRHRVALAAGARRQVAPRFADSGETARGVDDEIAVRLQPLGHVERLEQGRVLNDQRVGRLDRLAQPDLLVRDAAEGDDRRARALGAEARKGLRVLALEKCGDRQHLRRCDDALAAAAVNSHFEHGRSLTVRPSRAS